MRILPTNHRWDSLAYERLNVVTDRLWSADVFNMILVRQRCVATQLFESCISAHGVEGCGMFGVDQPLIPDFVCMSEMPEGLVHVAERSIDNRD